MLKAKEGNELMFIYSNEPLYKFAKAPDDYDWLRDTARNWPACLGIRHVVEGEKGGCRLVTVVFDDGTHETVKCVGGDAYDVNVGAALCVAYKAFGSRTAFRNAVSAKTAKPKPKKAAAKGGDCLPREKPKARRGRPRKVLNESSEAE